MGKRMSAEERRASILQAAVPLFAKHGFNGTTTRQIAKAAKVSEALLYRHFPSKEVLYQELQGYCTDYKDMANQAMLELDPSASTLVHIVYYIVHMIVKGHKGLHPGDFEHDDIHRMMVQSFLEDGAFARVFLDGKIEDWEDVFFACLKQAEKDGEMAPNWIYPSARMWMVHHLSVAVAILHLPEEAIIQYKFPREELIDQAVRFCLRGVGLTDEAIARYYNPKALALFTEKIGKN